MHLEPQLSVACTVTDAEFQLDAEFQNRIIQRDRTLNFPVVAQQPNPDPNFAPYYTAHQMAGRRVGAAPYYTAHQIAGRRVGAWLRAPLRC